MALSYLQSVFGEVPGDLKCFRGIAENDLRLVCQAMARRINTPLTSSCGRLFDAVASIIGLRQVISFEGQAAMELEMLADPDQSKAYPWQLSHQDGLIICDPAQMIEAIVNDHLSGVVGRRIAGRFHLSLAMMIEEVCAQLQQQTGLKQVVLSGGVFQNGLLTEMVVPRLEKAGLTVLTHTLVPPNDGGLALGQAVVAAA